MILANEKKWTLLYFRTLKQLLDELKAHSDKLTVLVQHITTIPVISCACCVMVPPVTQAHTQGHFSSSVVLLLRTMIYNTAAWSWVESKSSSEK